MRDIEFSDHGTICLFTPVSPEGEAWLEEHVDASAPRMGKSVACEHRYAAALIRGLTEAGLEVVS